VNGSIRVPRTVMALYRPDVVQAGRSFVSDWVINRQAAGGAETTFVTGN